MASRRWSFMMPAEDHRGMRWVLSRYRGRLTPRGRVLLWIGLVASIFSAQGTGSYLVPLTALSSLIAAWLVGLFFRPILEVHRHLGHHPTAGQIHRYRVRVVNRGRRRAEGVAVLEASLPVGLYMAAENDGGVAILPGLAPGEEAEVILAVRCSSRGVYDLEPLLTGTDFPSGLVRWLRREGGAQRLVVYPNFVTQQEFELPVGRRYQPGGVMVSAKVGESTEFFGTREHREGDRLRDVHWASSARRGQLVVKEHREEYFVRVGLVLDTAMHRRKEIDAFEHRVSLTAGIADALARRDHIIDLFAAGDEVHHLQSGRALARLDHVLELLACIEPVRRLDASVIGARLEETSRELSSIVVLLADWDEPRRNLVRGLERRGAGVRALVVRATAPTLPVDGEGAVVLIGGGRAGEMVR